MFIATRIRNGRVLRRIWVEDESPIALLKGDNTAKAAESQQAAFNAQLMTLFQQQFGQQSAIFNYLKPILQGQIDHPQGFSDTELSVLRTQADESAGNAYANARQASQEAMAARGGSELPSGVNDQIQGALASQAAAQTAGAQQNISLQNEGLKQANYWGAINALSGQEAMLNPLGYANAATSGSNAVAGLSQAVTASQQNGLLGGILGGVFGAGGALLGNPGLFGHSGGPKT